jgi:hypothetical protein
MAVLNRRVYGQGMALTLEERVELLEKKFVELTGKGDTRKTWQRTFGMSRDDPGFEEMMRLGQEYRRNLAEQDRKC